LDPGRLADKPLFAHLDQRGVSAIARGGWSVEVRRGDRVLARGELLDGLYLVIEGRLKLYMLSCNGDERVLRVMQPGDSFGEALMFNAMPSPVFVDALSASVLAFLPRDTIESALARDPDFTTAMLRSMSVLMRHLIGDLEACCLQSAAQRIAGYLLREFDTAPAGVIELPAAKAVVASSLNVSAETFSRELHQLREAAVIAVDRRRLTLLDRVGLAALAEGRGGVTRH
jgi:CRP-like cAMP-binding protein